MQRRRILFAIFLTLTLVPSGMLALWGWFGDVSQRALTLEWISLLLGIGLLWLSSFRHWEKETYRSNEKVLNELGSVVTQLAERKRELAQSEEALRRSSMQSRLFLDTAVDAVITIDEKGIVESFNAAAERMFGYAENEVVGGNVSLLMPEPFKQEHDGYLKKYLATREKRVIGIGREIIAKKRDGTIFPVQLYVGETDGEEARQFTGIIRDITDFNEAKKRIEEQASLLNNVREAIIVRDFDDHILFWNLGAERMYGWTAAAVLGRNAVDLLFRGDPDQLVAANRELLDKEEWHGEFKHVRRDGTSIVVESRWSLIHDEQGRPRGKVVIAIDVTDQKRLEMKILRAQRLESIGTLASGIAHDLNNVLTPILLATRLLERNLSEQERRRLLSTTRASAVRGTEMVKQLLSFAGGIEGERAPLDLKEVVREVQVLVEHTLPKSIDVRIELFEPLWLIVGDATQISQVLLNLVVNARDAMPEGGSLVVTARNLILNGNCPVIHPDASPGPYVFLSVTDTGIGIPPNYMEKVFDPFFTTKGVGKGTGLGLSTALGIIKSHGGFLNIYSEEGKGTRVNVYFPARESEETHEAVATARRAPMGEGETILVVDDEPLIRLTAKLTLESFGYHALTAADGNEALDIFREHAPDIGVILVDMMMPQMDGLAVIGALKEIDPTARIIATSGLQTKSRHKEALTAGASAFLPKPYPEEELLAAVKDLLSGKSE